MLPTVNASHGFSFAHCKPRRQSLDTLLPSGALLGLAPSSSLSQMDENLPTFIGQLAEGKFIKEEVFSLTLIGGDQGILSIGGTIQQAIATVEAHIENHLGRPQSSVADAQQQVPNGFEAAAAAGQGSNALPAAGVPLQGPLAKRDFGSDAGLPNDLLSKRSDDGMAQKVPTFEDLNPFNRAGRMKQHGQHMPSWKDGWKWSPVEGAAGWWQILMRGIWADQVKVMKNQPCIIDVSCGIVAHLTFTAHIGGRSTLLSSLPHHWPPKLSMQPYLDLTVSPHHTLISTPIPATIHPTFTLNSAAGDFPSCAGRRARPNTEVPMASSVWAKSATTVAIASAPWWRQEWALVMLRRSRR